MRKAVIAILLAVLTLLLCACGASELEPSAEISMESTPQLSESSEDTSETLIFPAYSEDIPALKELFSGDFLTGAAVSTGMLQNGTQSCKTILKHYNILTCENQMKPEYINPSEGVFDFTSADKFISFCTDNGIAAHGHCLVWHSQVLDWWFRGENGETADRDTLLERLHEYISTTAGRYAGKIKVWDVVNEAMNDDGTLRSTDGGSFYTSVIGDLNGDGHDYDYIEQAFIWAREADPDALLIYNDYSLESNAVKAQAVYDMLRDMLERGVPIDGVGLQMHIQYGWPGLDSVRKCIKLLSGLRELNPNFTVHITELDMSAFDWSDQSKTKDISRTQSLLTAMRWADLFDIFREEGVSSVTTWGVSDAGSWLDGYPVQGRTDSPLLFDRAFMTKPSYWALIDREKAKAAVEELYESAN